jgi:hypothetical protein
MLLIVAPAVSMADTTTLKRAVDTQIKSEIAAQKSQQRIDSLDDESRQMLAEYRAVLRQTESLNAYNDQLDKLVISQKNELVSINAQLENIETTQREIVPLMLDMINVMAQFIALDLPFLPEERNNRVEQLQLLMERADVSLAEKYRRILEAYQVETEYGRTIEAYQDELTVEGNSRTVEFLRIGRVGLYYLSLDGKEVGHWNNGWEVLDSDYRKAVEKGLKVAKKQLPPDLLVLPMKAAEVAK